MKQLESTNPSIRIYMKDIGTRLRELSHTPDHPPYASMIERAISELNDKGGSTEESISKFIETHYDDLSTAHASYLSHHLKKLVTKREIVCTSDYRYTLPCEYSDYVKGSKGQGRSRKLRQGRQCAVGRNQPQQNQRSEACDKHNQKCELKVSKEKLGSLIGEDVELRVVEDVNVEEEADEIISQEQCRTIDGMTEKQSEEEESHQARTRDEMTEDVPETFLRENTSGTPLVSNAIQVECEEALNQVRLENMKEQEGRCEGKKLAELAMEVRCHIKDLSYLLEQIENKNKENISTASSKYDADPVDQFDSSPFTPEESLQLMAKALKIPMKLNEFDEYNKFKLETVKKQKNSFDVHRQQSKETCIQQSESLLVHGCQPQQIDNCGRTDVSESQPKTKSASNSVQISLLMSEPSSSQREFPACKGPPDLLVKPCDQQKTYALLPESLHDKKENPQVFVESIEQTSSMGLQAVAELQESNTRSTEINLSITNTDKVINLSITNTDKVHKPSYVQSPDISAACVNAKPIFGECQANPTLNIASQEHVSRGPPGLLEELTTDIQQQITLSNTNVPLGFQQVGQEEQKNGQRLHTQAPPINEMLLKEGPTDDIAKQFVRIKKTPDQNQLSKLRPRGPTLSTHEPILNTLEDEDEDDSNTTIASLKAKLKGNSKGSLNNKPEVQGSQSAQAPVNSERQQNQEQVVLDKTPEPAINLQQTQELPHSSESLCLENMQSEESKQTNKRRGRPPKPKGSCTEVKEDKPKRPRGRPRKRKTDEEGKDEQGKPLKIKRDGDGSMEGSGKRGRGRPPKLCLMRQS